MEAVAPGLRLMVHQSSMSVSPAFRSGPESFVAIKFFIFPSWSVFIFMIKFHSGNGTWRMLQMDCISKAVTVSDLKKTWRLFGETDSNLPVVSSLRFRPLEEKPRGFGVLPLVDSPGSNLGPMSLLAWSQVVTCIQVTIISTRYYGATNLSTTTTTLSLQSYFL